MNTERGHESCTYLDDKVDAGREERGEGDRVWRVKDMDNLAVEGDGHLVDLATRQLGRGDRETRRLTACHAAIECASSMSLRKGVNARQRKRR